MSFNIHSTVRQVIASAEAKITNRSVLINSEIDSAIPYYVRGNQLMLTHVLHTMIEHTLNRVVAGKITIKAKAENLNNGFVTVSFMVAHTGSYLSVDFDNRLGSFNEKAIQKIGDLIKNCGGSLSEVACAGIGGQFRFSLKYAYAEVREVEPAAYENFMNSLLLRLGRMLSFPSVKAVHD